MNKSNYYSYKSSLLVGEENSIYANKLTKKELENTSYEIKNYEPLIALDGGEDGLNFYRDFSKKINKIMNIGKYRFMI